MAFAGGPENRRSGSASETLPLLERGALYSPDAAGAGEAGQQLPSPLSSEASPDSGSEKKKAGTISQETLIEIDPAEDDERSKSEEDVMGPQLVGGSSGSGNRDKEGPLGGSFYEQTFKVEEEEERPFVPVGDEGEGRRLCVRDRVMQLNAVGGKSLDVTTRSPPAHLSEPEPELENMALAGAGTGRRTLAVSVFSRRTLSHDQPTSHDLPTTNILPPSQDLAAPFIMSLRSETGATTTPPIAFRNNSNNNQGRNKSNDATRTSPRVPFVRQVKCVIDDAEPSSSSGVVLDANSLRQMDARQNDANADERVPLVSKTADASAPVSMLLEEEEGSGAARAAVDCAVNLEAAPTPTPTPAAEAVANILGPTAPFVPAKRPSRLPLSRALTLPPEDTVPLRSPRRGCCIRPNNNNNPNFPESDEALAEAEAEDTFIDVPILAPLRRSGSVDNIRSGAGAGGLGGVILPTFTVTINPMEDDEMTFVPESPPEKPPANTTLSEDAGHNNNINNNNNNNNKNNNNNTKKSSPYHSNPMHQMIASSTSTISATIHHNDGHAHPLGHAHVHRSPSGKSMPGKKGGRNNSIGSASSLDHMMLGVPMPDLTIRRVSEISHINELRREVSGMDHLASEYYEISREPNPDNISLDSIHKTVFQRCHNKYMPTERSTNQNKCFVVITTGFTLLGIVYGFWYKNFGPGKHDLH